jgi:Pilus assembly protein, PilO
MKKKTPQAAWIAAVAGAFLLVAVAGWFLLISPQRSKAADLQKQIDDTQSQIATARSLAAKAKNTPKIRIADLFRLTKAMPDQADMADIVLELNHVAKATGITFQSITPGGSVVLSGYQAVPITVIFKGNFYDLVDFLFRVRTLVDVRRGALAANGRMFAVDTLSFEEAEEHFPQIKATLMVDAFVFGTAAPATTAPPGTTTGATGGATTTTPTTTPTTTTAPAATTPSPPPPSSPPTSGATAAPAP